jgi:hypothetical protein
MRVLPLVEAYEDEVGALGGASLGGLADDWRS